VKGFRVLFNKEADRTHLHLPLVIYLQHLDGNFHFFQLVYELYIYTCSNVVGAKSLSAIKQANIWCKLSCV